MAETYNVSVYKQYSKNPTIRTRINQIVGSLYFWRVRFPDYLTVDI